MRVDFLGIGAQKAATSWLYVQLSNHPQIWFPAVKETHFWDRREGRDPSEWLAMFDEAPTESVRGEITPAYGPLSRETISEIERAAPDLRVFYSLRNPIDRAWSAALMELERTGRKLDETDDAWFLDEFRSEASLARGDYLGTIERWRGVLGEEAIQLLWFDEILRNPRDVLIALAEHLGVDPTHFRLKPEAELEQRIFAGTGDAVRPSLLAELQRIYREPIAALEASLEIDLSHWRNPVADSAEAT